MYIIKSLSLSLSKLRRQHWVFLIFRYFIYLQNMIQMHWCVDFKIIQRQKGLCTSMLTCLIYILYILVRRKLMKMVDYNSWAAILWLCIPKRLHIEYLRKYNQCCILVKRICTVRDDLIGTNIKYYERVEFVLFMKVSIPIKITFLNQSKCIFITL